MSDVQARVQALIDDFIEQGIERGLQVAAYHRGRLIVDAWGGVADGESGRAVDGDTLFTVWSVTKGIAATAVHILAERGVLDYDKSLAHYWPEFGVNGKGSVTLRHALAHTAGVPHMPEGVSAADMCDWELMTSGIAALTPAWEPGSAVGYHALTYGWLVGEPARRADGRPFAQIIQDEICRPLGIDSLFLGIPDEVEPRVARIESRQTLAPEDLPPPDSLVMRSLGPLARMAASDWANRSDVRRATIPGAGGIMNARAVARHYAALASGEVDGVRLLPSERINMASALEYDGPDIMSGNMHYRALGYHVGEPGSAMSGRPSCWGHGGAGGSLGYADPEYGFAFALCKTRMVDADAKVAAASVIARAIRAELDIPEL